jgi:molecular chaperone GrpE (heat shock protein)
VDAQPANDSAVTLADVTQKLDELRDLFRRRLLDDGDKRRLIDELHDRTRRAENGVSLEYLLPLVYRLFLIVDRLDDYHGADAAFADSIRRELLLALHQHGVESIEASGQTDPTWHELVAVSGRPPGDLVVTDVVQRGFRYGSRLLRPARVLAEYHSGGSANDGRGL